MVGKNKEKIEYADDDFESVGTLFRLRAPTLLLGLLLGIGISFAVSQFDEVLKRDIRVAFFLPFIVYLASAVGTQTEAIYSRDLKSGRARFTHYLWKEPILGILFGVVFGLFAGGAAYIWLGSYLLALSVATSTFAAIAIAPLVALIVTEVFQMIGEDPAVGSGPIATVLQDMTSIIIYGFVSSWILL